VFHEQSNISQKVPNNLLKNKGFLRKVFFFLPTTQVVLKLLSFVNFVNNEIEQVKIVSSRCPYSLPKIDDFHLK
jgi:hypothetical protein